MPDREAYDNSTWEAQNALMMPGAAEKWVEEAARTLYRLYHGDGSYS